MPAALAAVSTADQLEIQELVSRYNVAIDRSDVDGWLACFTEDGSFQGVAGRYEGLAAVRAFAEDLTTSDEWAPYRPMRHWTTNFIIEYDGGPDAAREGGERPRDSRRREQSGRSGACGPGG